MSYPLEKGIRSLKNWSLRNRESVYSSHLKYDRFCIRKVQKNSVVIIGVLTEIWENFAVEQWKHSL